MSSMYDTDRRLTFQELRTVNLRRVGDFVHGGLMSWNPAEWGNALAGEVGELCNVLKKMIRQQEKDPSPEECIELAKKEMADVQIYLDLIAARLDVSLADATINKFNESSLRIGSKVGFCSYPGCTDRTQRKPCPLCYE